MIVGNYTITIPAASFKKLMNGSKAGGNVFAGTLNGVSVAEQLSITGTNSFLFQASTSGMSQPLATTNPVTVTLTIGTDSSTVTVPAVFK